MKTDRMDPNMMANVEADESFLFRSVLAAPFCVHGLRKPEPDAPFFHRMPRNIAEQVNPGVARLYGFSAGGRIRFRTDSTRIGVKACVPEMDSYPTFSSMMMAGMDLYLDGEFKGLFQPPADRLENYTAVLETKQKKMQDVLIHLPPYGRIDSLEIGLDADAQLLSPEDYKITTPVVFYGSSITHGATTSRPGTSYPNLLSRRLNFDYLNLGFAGNALGEQAMAAFIAGLPKTALVCEYDHNSPNAEFLRKTHEPFIARIRQESPELPIVLMSRPRARFNDEEEVKRREVVLETYENARASGDNNIYFVDGAGLLNIFGGDNGTVDTIHPNDLGFTCIAKALGDVLEKIL